MAKPFYDRLRAYYENVGQVLRGEADTASIFPNTTDIGMERERVYAEFLRTHLPTCCNTLLGGFLFNIEGEESKQMDLIVTNDICPQYNLQNEDGQSKTFRCIDGCIAAVSVKSTLDTTQLNDALDNIASIPIQSSIKGKVNPRIRIPSYEDWPFKIIFAYDGVSPQTLLGSIDDFYLNNSSIPHYRKPNLIHVAGKYNIIRILPEGGKTRNGTEIPGNSFYPQEDVTDVFALQFAVQKIQTNALASQHILFNYDKILHNLPM